MEPVLLEKEGAVCWLTLNRPEKRNALSMEMISDMQSKLDAIAGDQGVRVVVIRGKGSMFCAGHDLREMAGPQYDERHFKKIFSECARMMQTLHRLPQPVIAQVHGIATAAGCQMVAACDIAVAESGANFSTPGVKIGLFCSTPAIPLVRVIGRRRAMEMLLTGRFVSAQEAQSIGLVNRVVEPDKLAAETRRLAKEISSYSRFTLAFGKKTFYRQVDMDEPEAYAYASEMMAANCLAEDAQEGMAAFLEKRDAVWKHK